MQPKHLFILATAAGAWLGYANPLAQLPLAALLLPAGLMVLGQNAATLHEAFKQAWLAGSLAALGCLYWVYWPVEHFGGVHWLLALPLPVLLSLAMGAYFGLFGIAAHDDRDAPRAAREPEHLVEQERVGQHVEEHGVGQGLARAFCVRAAFLAVDADGRLGVVGWTLGHGL